MKKFLLFCLLCPFCIPVSGQKDLSGTYYRDKSDIFLKIEADSLYFIVPQTYSIVRFSDTLAVCKFKWVDDNYIEINSSLPWAIGYNGFNIRQLPPPPHLQQPQNESVTDSIKVSFEIPYKYDILRIFVHTDKFKAFNLNYSEKSKELTLPGNIKSFSFAIFPENFIADFIYGGLPYGAMGYFSMYEFQITPGTKEIAIDLPALTNAFFEKYYVKGDYAKIGRNTITWKGDVYKKKR